jgi:RNA polymerase sigma-70 factor (ECF subfamily)
MSRRGASLEAIETVYRAQLPRFRRVAAAVAGDRELARDAVQEAFANAVRNRQDFRGDGPIDAWLWRTVVNAARTARRNALEDARLSDAECAPTNGRVESGAERVRAAVSLLPERQRLVLFLRYYADLDYVTIADATGLAPGTVGATLNAAHASMRRLLREVVT